VRNPVDRVIGMYNMFFNAKDAQLSSTRKNEPMRVFGPNDIAVIENHWEEPTENHIRWRFSLFLDWLLKRPTLTGQSLVHLTPQAKYLGVGCVRGNSQVDLVGRVELLPEVFDQIAEQVPRFKENYDAFKKKSSSANRGHLSNGGGVPAWTQTRMHDARGPWSMVPCLVDKALYAQINAVFVDDYACFGSQVFSQNHTWPANTAASAFGGAQQLSAKVHPRKETHTR